MKYLLSMVLVVLLSFLPMMAAVADEAVNAVMGHTGVDAPRLMPPLPPPVMHP